MLSMHIIIMHLATLPYRSILLCLGMQCSAQDYKRALLLAELCSDGRPILHKLGATHPMFKCVAIQVIRNHCCVDILHTPHSIVMLLMFDCATS